VNLSDAAVTRVMMPVDDSDGAVHSTATCSVARFCSPTAPMMASFESGAVRLPKSELWLAEFTDPAGNPLTLMSDVALERA